LEIKKRPTGITVIAILIIIGGILLLLAGIGGVVVGSLFISSQIIGLGFVIIGAIILAVGIGYLVVSYGLLKGKRWSWTITVVLLFIGIAIDVASIIIFGYFAINMDTSSFLTTNSGSIAGIIISVIILYYLYRPHVKSYFGKLFT
jgi:hypothetical protein